MKNKRKWLLSALLAFASIGMSAEEVMPGITLCMRAGNKVSFTFSQRPQLSLKDTELVITTEEGGLVTYATDAVQRIVFEDEVVSAVHAATVKGDVSFALKQNNVYASGLSVGERIDVVGIDGKLQQSVVATSDGVAVVSLSSLPTGVYVVRTQGGVSFKFVKQ